MARGADPSHRPAAAPRWVWTGARRARPAPPNGGSTFGPNGTSGLKLAERLRRQYPSMRLLLMSGHVDASVLPDVEVSTVPFMPKPFTPERLARRIREVLDADRLPH